VGVESVSTVVVDPAPLTVFSFVFVALRADRRPSVFWGVGAIGVRGAGAESPPSETIKGTGVGSARGVGRVVGAGASLGVAWRVLRRLRLTSIAGFVGSSAPVVMVLGASTGIAISIFVTVGSTLLLVESFPFVVVSTFIGEPISTNSPAARAVVRLLPRGAASDVSPVVVVDVASGSSATRVLFFLPMEEDRFFFFVDVRAVGVGGGGGVAMDLVGMLLDGWMVWRIYLLRLCRLVFLWPVRSG